VLMKHIRPSIRRTCTVADSMLNHSWAREIRGELLVDALRGLPPVVGCDSGCASPWSRRGRLLPLEVDDRWLLLLQIGLSNPFPRDHDPARGDQCMTLFRLPQAQVARLASAASTVLDDRPTAKEGASDAHHVSFVRVERGNPRPPHPAVPFRTCHLDRSRDTPPVAQHRPFDEHGDPGMVASGGGAVCGSRVENH
jgi:hypothetical protein